METKSIREKLIENQVEAYKLMFIKERKKIKYIQLRTKIIFYCFDHCDGDYSKSSITNEEIECIKNRTYTYLNYYRDFNINEVENFIGTNIKL